MKKLLHKPLLVISILLFGAATIMSFSAMSSNSVLTTITRDPTDSQVPQESILDKYNSVAYGEWVQGDSFTKDEIITLNQSIAQNGDMWRTDAEMVAEDFFMKNFSIDPKSIVYTQEEDNITATCQFQDAEISVHIGAPVVQDVVGDFYCILEYKVDKV